MIGSPGSNFIYMTMILRNQVSPILNMIKKDFRTAALVLGGAFVGAGIMAAASAVKMSANYEQAMLKVQALAAQGLHGKQSLTDVHTQMGVLSQKTLALATTIPLGPIALANALYPVASSGFKAADAITVLKYAAMDAAIGGLHSATDQADVLSSVLRGYGATAKDAGSYNDQLISTVTRGKMQMTDLKHSFAAVLPTAQALKINFAEVGAAMATMTLHGSTATLAAQGVNRLLLSITKPTKGAMNVAKILGLDSLFSKESLQKYGLANITKAIFDSTGGNSNLIKGLFPDLRAFRSELQLAGGTNAATFAGNLKAISTSAKGGQTTIAAFKTTMQGFNQQINLLKSRLQVAAIELGLKLLPYAKAAIPVIGQALLGAVRALSATFDRVSVAIKGFNTHNQQLRQIIVAVVAVLVMAVSRWIIFNTVMTAARIIVFAFQVPLLAVKSALTAYRVVTDLSAAAVKAWGVATTIVSGITKAWSIITGAQTIALFGLNIALGPMLLAIGAIVLVVGVVVLAFRHWYDTNVGFRTAVNNVVGVLKALWENTKALFGPVFQLIGLFVRLAVTSKPVQQAVGNIRDALGSLVSFIINKVIGAIQSLGGLLMKLGGLPGLGALKDIGKAIGSFVTGGTVTVTHKQAVAGAGGLNMHNARQAQGSIPVVSTYAPSALNLHLRTAAQMRAGLDFMTGTAQANAKQTKKDRAAILAMDQERYRLDLKRGASQAVLSADIKRIGADMAVVRGNTPAQQAYIAQHLAALKYQATHTTKHSKTLDEQLRIAKLNYDTAVQSHASTAAIKAAQDKLVAATVAQQGGSANPLAIQVGAALRANLDAHLAKLHSKMLGPTFFKAQGFGRVEYARQPRVAPGFGDAYGASEVAIVGSAQTAAAKNYELLKRQYDQLRAMYDSTVKQLDLSKQQLAVDTQQLDELRTITGHTGQTAAAASKRPQSMHQNLRSVGAYTSR